MKVRDYIELQRLFSPKEKKEKKMKSELSLKDFIKFQKELKEFEEWQKSQKKPDAPKGPWEKLSVWQKLTILMITVPVALMAEVTVLMLFGLQIAKIFSH